jgi:hypothetical protein
VFINGSSRLSFGGISTGSNASPRSFIIDATITIRAVSASGTTVIFGGTAMLTAAGTEQLAGSWPQVRRGSAALDTTADLTVDVQAVTGNSANATWGVEAATLCRMPA